MVPDSVNNMDEDRSYKTSRTSLECGKNDEINVFQERKDILSRINGIESFTEIHFTKFKTLYEVPWSTTNTEHSEEHFIDKPKNLPN